MHTHVSVSVFIAADGLLVRILAVRTAAVRVVAVLGKGAVVVAKQLFQRKKTACLKILFDTKTIRYTSGIEKGYVLPSLSPLQSGAK